MWVLGSISLWLRPRPPLARHKGGAAPPGRRRGHVDSGCTMGSKLPQRHGSPARHDVRAWQFGLATLTKGPVGCVLPILTALAYLTVRRHWKALWGRDGLLCLGTFLGVTLTWFVPAIAQGGMAYAQATLWHHTLERFVRAWEHTAPWYFYFGAFPAEVLPWTLFLPQALVGRVPSACG
jgi:hypothetical protein